MDHDVTVVEGHSVMLSAHGEVWTLTWSELESLGGSNIVGRLECPGCSAQLDDTEGSLSLAVPMPGYSCN